MKYLLDTHIFYWLLTNTSKIPEHILDIIKTNEVYISAICPWELNVKQDTGKLKFPFSPEDEITKLGFKHLSITAKHTKQVKQLPNIHRDPFDRMLIAQSLAEEMILITADKTIAKYNIPMVTI